MKMRMKWKRERERERKKEKDVWNWRVLELTFDWSTQNDLYCSDESFKTPLESPGGEKEYYYNGFNAMKTMNGYVDVNEAFAIHDRMPSQS